MPVVANLLDSHVVKLLDLIGLFLNLLGAAFFAYAAIGKDPDSPLRKLIRLGMPGLLGGLVYIPLSALEGLGVIWLTVPLVSPTSSESILSYLSSAGVYGVLVAPFAYGVFLGVMIASIAAQDQKKTKPPDLKATPRFSRKRFRTAVILAGVYEVLVILLAIFINYGGVWNALQRNLLVGALFLVSAVAFALTLGVVAGWWEAGARAIGPLPGVKQSAVLGAAAAFVLSFVPALFSDIASVIVLVASNVSHNAASSSLNPGPFFLAIAGGSLIDAFGDAVLGAVIGAVFWWALRRARKADERDMQVIGMTILIFGFIVQMVDPIVGILAH